MAEKPSSRRFGTAMLVLAWTVGLALAANWFAGIEERQRNPNRQPESLHTESVVEVRLDSNRQGHYLVGGQINGTDVTFLLDTGATFVAIPAQVADELGLTRGRPVMVSTANGLAESYSTHIESLALGDIRLRDVAAGIVPGMSGDEILLGMSALRQLDFSQQGGQLILRQNR